MTEHDGTDPVADSAPQAESTPSDGPGAERSSAPASAAASTGDARVDEALTKLTDLDRLPVHDHVAVIEDVHRSLQDTLAEEQD